MYLNVLRRAMAGGILYGYRYAEESTTTIRGRMRFIEQARRRVGLALPMEVAYDDFTMDIEANRILKAALRRALRLPLADRLLRSRITEALGHFDAVADVRFGQDLSEPALLRQQARFRTALSLACLILRNTSLELEEELAKTTGLLFNLNDVFEDFVYAGIGQHLRPGLAFGNYWLHGEPLELDVRGVIKPVPDLTLWRGGRCDFVGDAKYKRTSVGYASDVYQMLAYCNATNLHTGLLVYGEAGAQSVVHEIVHDGPRIIIDSLDVESPLFLLQQRLESLAEQIRKLARVD